MGKWLVCAFFSDCKITIFFRFEQIKNALFGNLAYFCLGTWRISKNKLYHRQFFRLKKCNKTHFIRLKKCNNMTIDTTKVKSKKPQ